MIIQAIPGSGKSFATAAVLEEAGNSKPAHVIQVFDTDVFVEDAGYTGRFDELLEDRSASNRFFEKCRRADQDGILLTNLHLDRFRMRVDIRFCYYRSDYYEHLRCCGRTDLLKRFSRVELEGWITDYSKCNNVCWLHRGSFILPHVSTISSWM